MDVVCPLGNGSKWFDNELRYSLRSLEKFGHNVGNVFIVGECPDWVTNVIHIPAKDGVGHERNIMNKLLAACNDERVSENFGLWNDDYFLTDYIDLDKYPRYQCGTLREKIDKRIRFDGYRMSMENTRDFLKDQNKFTLFYDTHCPIIYNKQKFKELMNIVDWEKRNGYVIKSLYANYYPESFRYMEDKKFTADTGILTMKQEIKDRHIFSIADGVMFSPTKTMKVLLEELYPLPSKYEIR